MNRNNLFIVGGAGVMVLIIIVWLFNPFGGNKSQIALPSSSPQAKLLINTIPVQDRPYITLEPKSKIEPKSLGHWARVTLHNDKGFSGVEYEFEYRTASIIQGGMGRLDFAKEPTPVSKDIAFGSESKGKYKYDDGVIGGSFTFSLLGSTPAVLKTDFSLSTGGEGPISSTDSKVSLSASGLQQGDYLIIANTLGLPASLEGEIISGPYGFYADSSKTLGKAEISFKTDKNEASIWYWDEKAWKKLETKVADNKAVAKIEELGTFVLAL